MFSELCLLDYWQWRQTVTEITLQALIALSKNSLIEVDMCAGEAPVEAFIRRFNRPVSCCLPIK